MKRQHSRDIDDAKKQIKNVVLDNNWAKKLLNRYKNGEILLPIQINYMKEVLGLRELPKRDREREPGDDDN